jgi:hypothetical protein
MQLFLPESGWVTSVLLYDEMTPSIFLEIKLSEDKILIIYLKKKLKIFKVTIS